MFPKKPRASRQSQPSSRSRDRSSTVLDAVDASKDGKNEWSTLKQPNGGNDYSVATPARAYYDQRFPSSYYNPTRGLQESTHRYSRQSSSIPRQTWHRGYQRCDSPPLQDNVKKTYKVTTFQPSPPKFQKSMHPRTDDEADEGQRFNSARGNEHEQRNRSRYFGHQDSKTATLPTFVTDARRLQAIRFAHAQSDSSSRSTPATFVSSSGARQGQEYGQQLNQSAPDPREQEWEEGWRRPSKAQRDPSPQSDSSVKRFLNRFKHTPQIVSAGDRDATTNHEFRY